MTKGISNYVEITADQIKNLDFWRFREAVKIAAFLALSVYTPAPSAAMMTGSNLITAPDKVTCPIK